MKGGSRSLSPVIALLSKGQLVCMILTGCPRGLREFVEHPARPLTLEIEVAFSWQSRRINRYSHLVVSPEEQARMYEAEWHTQLVLTSALYPLQIQARSLRAVEKRYRRLPNRRPRCERLAQWWGISTEGCRIPPKWCERVEVSLSGTVLSRTKTPSSNHRDMARRSASVDGNATWSVSHPICFEI